MEGVWRDDPDVYDGYMIDLGAVAVYVQRQDDGDATWQVFGQLDTIDSGLSSSVLAARADGIRAAKRLLRKSIRTAERAQT